MPRKSAEAVLETDEIPTELSPAPPILTIVPDVEPLPAYLVKRIDETISAADPTERFYSGRFETRMHLAAEELAFLIQICPQQIIRTILSSRAKRFQELTWDKQYRGWPLAVVYVPVNGPYMFPLTNGRSVAMTPQDAIYGLHQSERLLATYWPDITEGEEILLAAPTALEMNMPWFLAIKDKEPAA